MVRGALLALALGCALQKKCGVAAVVITNDLPLGDTRKTVTITFDSSDPQFTATPLLITGSATANLAANSKVAKIHVGLPSDTFHASVVSTARIRLVDSSVDKNMARNEDACVDGGKYLIGWTAMTLDAVYTPGNWGGNGGMSVVGINPNSNTGSNQFLGSNTAVSFPYALSFKVCYSYTGTFSGDDVDVFPSVINVAGSAPAPPEYTRGNWRPNFRVGGPISIYDHVNMRQRQLGVPLRQLARVGQPGFGPGLGAAFGQRDVADPELVI